jgi:1-deoxy-D-xylulose-5-phosphate reductoisomerase
LSAHRNLDLLQQQALQWKPRWVAVTDSSTPGIRPEEWRGTEWLWGDAGICRMVTDPEVDIVVSAIVGSAGLTGTWAALDAGKTVALANKETLVAAGELVADLVAAKGGKLLPVDSEHSAIFQAIQGSAPSEVERIVLTASGGPFRGKSRAELEDVSADMALKHPTWRMGAKITIDSATLMNKALEIIEARWLFNLSPDQIEVIIHPESIVHSFVEFRDGSIMAQLSPPDMRLPIQYALTYPERIQGPARRLAWRDFQGLQFEQPDPEAFPALGMGYEVARRGGSSGAVLNAANEAAVNAFLEGRLSFLDISRVCREVLDHHHFEPRPGLAELLSLDRWARREVARWTRNPIATIKR